MKKRMKNRAKDRAYFKNTAQRTRAVNLYGTAMRGGIRL